MLFRAVELKIGGYIWCIRRFNFIFGQLPSLLDYCGVYGEKRVNENGYSVICNLSLVIDWSL